MIFFYQFKCTSHFYYLKSDNKSDFCGLNHFSFCHKDAVYLMFDYDVLNIPGVEC